MTPPFALGKQAELCERIEWMLKNDVGEEVCGRSMTSFSDSRPLRLCFDAEFCEELTRDVGKFTGPCNTHDR